MHIPHNILEQVIAIARRDTEQDLERAEEILLNHLKNHPQDTQAWLLLMMIEWNPPLEDFERIIKWARTVLAYDPTNAYALLVLAEAYCVFWGNIDGTIYEQLCNAHDDDPNVRAMIEVAKAKYLEDKEDRQEEYEAVLKKSIEYGPDQAKNYYMLGQFYIKNGRHQEGEALVQKSLENQKKANVEWTGDPTSLTEFFDEWYTGL